MEPGDYPAAHSMDTEWFAVDKNGRVALFSSGEAGAVPKTFMKNFGQGTNLLEHLIQLHGQQPHSMVTEWLKYPLMLNGKEAKWEELPDGFWKCIVRLPSKPKKNAWGVLIAAGYFESAIGNRDGLKAKMEAGDFTHLWVGVGLANLLGCITYDHGDQWENWICGPYEREFMPSAPVRVGDLPAEITECDPVVFGTHDFTTDEWIQPVESVPCEAWEKHFVATDGRTIRPVPPEKNLKLSPEEVESLQRRGFLLGAPNIVEEKKPFWKRWF